MMEGCSDGMACGGTHIVLFIGLFPSRLVPIPLPHLRPYYVQTLHFGDHTNIYDIDQKEDEENTSETVVQDETNTIPVLSTTGIRFSSADPGIPFSVGDVMKSQLISLLLVTRSLLYMYDQIMSFCSTAQEAGFIFESSPPRRTTVLKEFQNRFNMNEFNSPGETGHMA